MRVVGAVASAPSRSTLASPGERQQARLEILGLAFSTLVIALGLFLAYQHQGPALEQAEAGLRAGTTVDLFALRNARALLPLLTTFDSAAEREFAAQSLVALTARGRLTHVGALASVTVPATEVRSKRQFAVLNAKLAVHPGVDRVPLLSPSDIALIKPSLVVRAPHVYRQGLIFTAALFFGLFWAAHVVRRWVGRIGDGILLPAAQLLTGLSLLTMIGLRDPLRDTDAVGSVAAGVAVGLMFLIVISFIDFEQPRWRRATLAPLGLAVSLAATLLLFGSGPGESGVKINLLGMQPIEPIRLFAVLAVASYLGRRWEMLRELSRAVGPSPRIRRYFRLPQWRHAQPLVIIVGTLVVFFFLQRDMGPALVLGSLALAMYGVARGKAPLVVTGFATLVAAFVGAYWLDLPRTLARRVAIWIDPWNNGLIGGDQIAHGLWAMATGGTVGLGPAVGNGQLVPAGHTDLIVAVLGENLGFIGVLVAATVFSLVIWRILRIAIRAQSTYSMFLALGCALALAVPAIVIVSGLLGLMPLSGVVTPFLSFGKSSMVCNFIALGVVMSIARGSSAPRPEFVPQFRVLHRVLAGIALVIVGRAASIQVLQADDLALRPTLVRQADGVPRYQYNPRILIAARSIRRGTIYDRNGLALATSEAGKADAMFDRLRKIGRFNPPVCPPAPARCYPLPGAAFHLLGDADQTNWTARNASFIERDSNQVLQGFDDHAATVRVQTSGQASMAVIRDYRDLLPLLRHRDQPDRQDVKSLLGRSRDVHVTLDGPLQALVAGALQSRVHAAGSDAGAAVVLDVDTGAVLASASYPWPLRDRPQTEQLLDRARYGLYPPGSTFKLVTAAAALTALPSGRMPEFMCVRLRDGRVGAEISANGRLIRDDVLDHEPHGRVDLHRGLVVSCNAYFAQLARYIGADALAACAKTAQIQIANQPLLANLRRTLPFAGYGQGEVVATPLRMARVVEAIATDGTIREAPLVTDPRATAAVGTNWITPDTAGILRRAMRDIVQSGTARVLAGHAVPIAGKTGTAEVEGGKAHSWFVGYAPATPRAGHRIAFAVVIENGGYGGRVAAALAGDIVTAAREVGAIK